MDEVLYGKGPFAGDGVDWSGKDSEREVSEILCKSNCIALEKP